MMIIKRVKFTKYVFKACIYVECHSKQCSKSNTVYLEITPCLILRIGSPCSTRAPFNIDARAREEHFFFDLDCTL